MMSRLKNEIKPFFENKYDFTKPLYIDNEIIYSNKNFFKKQKGKSILIVGGGGSSKNLNIDILNSYDYIWSMNHFFLHPILKNYYVDIAMICPEVNLNNLIPYLNKFKTNIGFEYTGWNIRNFKEINSFYEKDKKFGMHTKIYNQLGYGVRMLVLACYTGASTVDFIGFDGPKAILNKDHGFQPGKSVMPNSAKNNPFKFFQSQYDQFWSYIKRLFPKININNIANDNNKMHRMLNV